jgi:hypothetical protein
MSFSKSAAVGLLILIVVILIGFGGGFFSLVGLGKLVSKVPVWFWLLIGVLWLITQARRTK